MKKEEALEIYNALSEKIQKEEEESFSSTLLSIAKTSRSIWRQAGGMMSK